VGGVHALFSSVVLATVVALILPYGGNRNLIPTLFWRETLKLLFRQT
jgi:hypothetical protein